ncbi:MAG: sugar phosphate isomerase/epimerase [Anaerolineae bacterium]|nr:hypothetical protein [Thermoflexales bacterium]MDW8407667.1 sugar phosphate isomerase/epimerase [Anaerolineae bacterium]
MEIFQATWAMRDLPGQPGPFDLPAAVAWTRNAGFSGILHWAETPDDLAEVEIIRRAGLLVGVGFPARNMQMAERIIDRATGLGVSFLNAQVYDAFAADDEAVARLEGLYALSDARGIPLFIETHRGMVTQDLLRTVAYARRLPRMLFTLDASHYVVAGEITQPEQSPRFNAALAEIIARTASIHARVSNGEQIQVDVLSEDDPLVRPFIGWWTAAFEQWLGGAAPGAFFPFVCELGPRPYAIAAPAGLSVLRGLELSDRLAQALLLKRIAEQIQTRVCATISTYTQSA